MKYWEIIADISRKPVGVGAASQPLDSTRRMIWIVDAHRDNGKRFVVRVGEKLTAFLELESAIAQMNRSGFAEGHFGRDFTIAIADTLAMLFEKFGELG